MIYRWLKIGLTAIAVLLVFPTALLSGFGQITAIFTLFAHAWAIVPGKLGDYGRLAYYMMTLRSCSWECQIAFGSYFAHREASVGRYVGIGPYCVIGKTSIGEGSKIGGMVQILSGTQQHKRDASGRIVNEGGEFVEIHIGSDCWIGVSSVIAADVGSRSTVSVGSVVVSRVPEGVVVAGNPAKKVWPLSAHA